MIGGFLAYALTTLIILNVFSVVIDSIQVRCCFNSSSHRPTVVCGSGARASLSLSRLTRRAFLLFLLVRPSLSFLPPSLSFLPPSLSLLY